MIKSKGINIITGILMGIIILFIILLTYFPEKLSAETSSYESTLFDKDKIMSIDIRMSDDDWTTMLENASKEEYVECDVVVNGTIYWNVGIRPKGNSSLMQIMSDDTTDRHSFKIEFDYNEDQQYCEGLDKLVLNNLMSDTTYMKEYLSYDLFHYMGVPSPKCSFANIAINGKAWGLYTAIEGIEEAFAKRNFGFRYGELYKPETPKLDTERISSSYGAGLIYTNDYISSYSDVFDNAVFEPNEEDYANIIEAIKNLNSGTDLKKYIDVDECLRYIAVNTVLVNVDSYFGKAPHNYYLYEENAKLSMIPWDYNQTFGSFIGHDAKSAVNFPIDSPVYEVGIEERPLIAKLLAVDEFKEKYHMYLKKIVKDYFKSGLFESKVSRLDQLIGDAVANDPTAFYTYDEYKTGIDTLIQFTKLRKDSIQRQLNGEIPSTKVEQDENQEILVDASTIIMKNMGTQKGGLEAFLERNEEEVRVEPVSVGVQEETILENMDQSESSTDHINITTCVIWVVSIFTLLIALIIVQFYRRRKYSI